MLSLHAFLNPSQILPRTGGDRYHHKFRDVVAVEAFHFPFELSETRNGGLNEEQSLPGGFHFPFPPINRLDPPRQDICARGQPLSHHGFRDLSRLTPGRAGDQYDSCILPRYHPPSRDTS